jgi:hypothetical protein
MVTVVNEARPISVPEGVTDLESFRRWTESDDFPEDVRIWWLKGKVWIDMRARFEFCGRRVTPEVRRAGSVSDRRMKRRNHLRPPVADAPGSPLVPWIQMMPT